MSNFCDSMDYIAHQDSLRRRHWQPTPVLLPGESHGQRSLVGCTPWVTKSRTRLSDFTFIFHFHALEKEMATHSSVLAWRVPGMEEPGGRPSVGSHRVWYDWHDLAVAAGFSVCGILQARTLEWVTIPFSRGPTQGLNLGLLHCRQTLYSLNHQESL